MGQAKRFGACANSQEKVKDNDPEKATAQNPKHLDGGLALVEKVRPSPLVS